MFGDVINFATVCNSPRPGIATDMLPLASSSVDDVIDWEKSRKTKLSILIGVFYCCTQKTFD